jgi:hypothetical protein
MDVSSLDVYVLLHLMKFVKPVDRINLLLSGIVKGFENVSEGFNLRQRYSGHFIFVISGNRIVICSESNIVKLNWDYVVVARANWKSGESLTIDK